MRIVKTAIVAAGVAGMIATAVPANAAEFAFRIPATPCTFYTSVDVHADPQDRPPVDTTGTDVGVRCTP